MPTEDLRREAMQRVKTWCTERGVTFTTETADALVEHFMAFAGYDGERPLGPDPTKMRAALQVVDAQIGGLERENRRLRAELAALRSVPSQ